MLTLGTSLDVPDLHTALEIVTDSVDLQPHVDTPWFRAYVNRYSGATSQTVRRSGTSSVTVGGEALARHSLLVGPSPDHA